MKRIFVLVTLLLSNSVVIAAPMARVLEVRSSRIIVVETNGVTSIVDLRGVQVAPDEELVATDWLRRALTRTWVLVESGEVYRSPDALHINDAMRRRAWLGAIYLGELDLRPPARQLPTAGKKPPPQTRSKRPSKPRGRP